jgi:hypothetical protein
LLFLPGLPIKTGRFNGEAMHQRQKVKMTDSMQAHQWGLKKGILEMVLFAYSQSGFIKDRQYLFARSQQTETPSFVTKDTITLFLHL